MADSTDEEKKTGVFCGWMKGLLVHDYCLSFAEAERLHAQYPCGQKEAALSINRAAWKNDIQRPAYHLIAPGKWMNEPHAPVYYKGNYHIFYQANVHAPIWNHIQWGHMISTDMVHWRDLPLALETEEGSLDPDGCWSGSALIDKNGLPRIYYTAGNNEKFPNQSVAMAVSDAEDMELDAGISRTVRHRNRRKGGWENSGILLSGWKKTPILCLWVRETKITAAEMPYCILPGMDWIGPPMVFCWITNMRKMKNWAMYGSCRYCFP